MHQIFTPAITVAVGLQRAILQILHLKVIVIHLGVTVLYVDTSKNILI